MENYGDRIADLRRENGWTQEQLGEKLCVTAQAVSKWERNLSEPDIATLRRMSELFEVSVDYILGADAVEDDEDADEDEEEVEEEEAEPVPTAVCTVCGKMLFENEVTIHNGKAMCEVCLQAEKRRLAAIAAKKKTEQERAQQEAARRIAAERAMRHDELFKPLLYGAIGGVIGLIAGIVTTVMEGIANPATVGGNIGLTIFGIYLWFCLVYEIALRGSYGRKMFYALTHLTGNDPNRVVYVGCTGCLFSVLGGLIKLALAIAAVIFFPIYSLGACPIDLVIRIRNYRG